MPATIAYPDPSETNFCTSCRRCVPIARAIPISLRRSAASIVKIRTISSTPAETENSPSTRKTEVNISEMLSAPSTDVILTAEVPTCSPSNAGTSSVRMSRVGVSALRTPPVVEMKTPVNRLSWPVSACSRSSGSTMLIDSLRHPASVEFSTTAWTTNSVGAFL